MADLYTSLIRAKLELNDGVLPPMTPVPENVQHFIDPAFTPGLGALEEDPEKGLRCPVKGCGEYRQSLRKHLNSTHRDIGGARAVLRALSIPIGLALISRRMAKKQRDAGIKNKAALKGMPQPACLATRNTDNKAGKTYTRRTRLANHRNLTNTCEAQISHRLWDLYHKVGRSPGHKEAVTLTGDHGLVGACDRIYGSWNAAKAAVGMDHTSRGNHAQKTKQQATVMLQAWFAAHGRLPLRTEAVNPQRTPLIPTSSTITRLFGTSEWSVAMRRAAIRMGVYDTRYRPEPGKHSVAPPQYTRDSILREFGVFHAEHGYLPKCCAQPWPRTGDEPGLPSKDTILKYMETNSWPDAMRQVAEHLDIYDARYRPAQTA